MAASPWLSRRPVWIQAASCPAPTSTAGSVAGRQAEDAYVQCGATLTTVYSTFSVTFQNTHTPRERATIVRRTVTAPPENAPAEHSPLRACRTPLRLVHRRGRCASSTSRRVMRVCSGVHDGAGGKEKPRFFPASCPESRIFFQDDPRMLACRIIAGPFGHHELVF